MKTESQRIAIAEAYGWRRIEGDKFKHTRNRWINPNDKRSYAKDYAVLAKHLPDYLNDLNAMHEAEKMLTDRKDQNRFLDFLIVMDTTIMCEEWRFSHATAAQRAEAFLKCLGLWT